MSYYPECTFTPLKRGRLRCNACSTKSEIVIVKRGSAESHRQYIFNRKNPRTPTPPVPRYRGDERAYHFPFFSMSHRRRPIERLGTTIVGIVSRDSDLQNPQLGKIHAADPSKFRSMEHTHAGTSGLTESSDNYMFQSDHPADRPFDPFAELRRGLLDETRPRNNPPIKRIGLLDRSWYCSACETTHRHLAGLGREEHALDVECEDCATKYRVKRIAD